MAAEEKSADTQEEEPNAFHFKLRNVPNDHSCLFHSIGYLLDYDRYSKDLAYHYELRKIVSSRILQQTESDRYEQHLLAENKTREEYAKEIMDQFTWGGDLDALILAEHFDRTVLVLDATANVFYALNAARESKTASNAELEQKDNDCEHKRDTKRLHIIYSGEHYDAVVGIPKGENELDVATEIRQFDLKQLNEEKDWSRIEQTALKRFLNEQHLQWKEKKQIMEKMKSARKYQCKDCEKVCHSEQAMVDHMNETQFDHSLFDEI